MSYNLKHVQLNEDLSIRAVWNLQSELETLISLQQDAIDSLKQEIEVMESDDDHCEVTLNLKKVELEGLEKVMSEYVEDESYLKDWENLNGDVYYIPEGKIDEYIKDRAIELDELDKNWIKYIDWDLYIQDAKTNYSETEFSGNTYFYI